MLFQYAYLFEYLNFNKAFKSSFNSKLNKAKTFLGHVALLSQQQYEWALVPQADVLLDTLVSKRLKYGFYICFSVGFSAKTFIFIIALQFSMEVKAGELPGLEKKNKIFLSVLTYGNEATLCRNMVE